MMDKTLPLMTRIKKAVSTAVSISALALFSGHTFSVHLTPGAAAEC
jgi:hypothetical protein